MSTEAAALDAYLSSVLQQLAQGAVGLVRIQSQPQRLVKKGDVVKRGQKIGTMGNNRGMYAAHLHFEIRHNINIGMQRESFSKSDANWADPTACIKKYRRLKKEWRPVVVPTGTYKVYRVHTGL